VYDDLESAARAFSFEIEEFLAGFVSGENPIGIADGSHDAAYVSSHSRMLLDDVLPALFV